MTAKKTSKKLVPTKVPGKPRQKQLSRKSTDDEIARRIDYLTDLLATMPNVSRYKLHDKLGKKWKVGWRMIDEYVARAREALLQRTNNNRNTIQSKAQAFYEAIISNPLEETKTRLKAQQLLVELFGANAPRRTELSGPEGGPIQTENTNAEMVAYMETCSVEQLRAIVEGIVDNKV